MIKKLILTFVLLLILNVSNCYAYYHTLRDHIVANEGLRLFPYFDAANGAIIIGYGHNLSAKGITQEAAQDMLDYDLIGAIVDLNIIFEDFRTFSDSRKIALIDMIFCMGKRKFLTFKKLIKAVKRLRWKAASKEVQDSLWYRHYTTRATKCMKLLFSGV